MWWGMLVFWSPNRPKRTGCAPDGIISWTKLVSSSGTRQYIGCVLLKYGARYLKAVLQKVPKGFANQEISRPLWRPPGPPLLSSPQYDRLPPLLLLRYRCTFPGTITWRSRIRLAGDWYGDGEASKSDASGTIPWRQILRPIILSRLSSLITLLSWSKLNSTFWIFSERTWLKTALHYRLTLPLLSLQRG